MDGNRDKWVARLFSKAKGRISANTEIEGNKKLKYKI